MESKNIFKPVPCAEEIVGVLEKHQVGICDMQEVLEMAKDIALSSTRVEMMKNQGKEVREIHIHNIRGYSVEVGDICPFGKDEVIQCIKNVGKYLIDNADEIGEEIENVTEIRLDCRIGIDGLPTVEVLFREYSEEKLKEIIGAGYKPRKGGERNK